jgi:DNA (cytosine-5)-methyltransferase 1
VKVVSLFSGAGGLDFGFAQAGHTIVWAVDNWKDAVETYRMNLGNHIIEANIEDVSTKGIPDADIVIGGFPCQGFSVANTKRHTSDRRNKLYLEFIRVLRDKKPPFFLAENVKGILSLGGGSVFKLILSDFKKIGYGVQYCVLNAADYGVPQNRERVFLLGKRQGILAYVDFPPKRTHAREGGSGDNNRLKPWVTVGEALAGLPDPDQANGLKNHQSSKYKLTFTGYLGHREVNPNRPSPTITARGDHRGGVVVLPHPSNQRRITPREAAIIQSFPIDFKFYGSKTSVYRQVANAVPPLLAKALAKPMLNIRIDTLDDSGIGADGHREHSRSSCSCTEEAV